MLILRFFLLLCAIALKMHALLVVCPVCCEIKWSQAGGGAFSSACPACENMCTSYIYKV